MTQPPNGGPWLLNLFRDPTLVANVVAFGAAVLLLYTAAVRWPREVERFDSRAAEVRETARENQKILQKLEVDREAEAAWRAGVAKALQEILLRQEQAERKAKGGGES